MKNNNDNLDKIISNVLKENIEEIDNLNDIDIPPMENVFKEIRRKQLHKNKTKKRKQLYLKRVSLIFVCLIFTCIFSVILNSRSADAFKFKVRKFIHDVKNNVIQHTDSEGTPGNPPISENSYEEVLTLEQGKKRKDLNIQFPDYIPEDYEFKEIKVQNYMDSLNIIKISYNSIDHESLIEITQRNDVEGAYNSVYSKNTNAKIEEKHGLQFIYIYKDDTVYTVYWIRDDTEFILCCSLPFKEANKIVDSFFE